MYYARFDTSSYHCFTETHINARLNVNNATHYVKSQQSQSSTKSGLKALGHSAGLKSMPRTITMQGLTYAAITVSEKST